MDDVNRDPLSDALVLIQAGQMAAARKILQPLILANLQNIPAWLLQAEACATVEEKKKVLEMCLRFNPAAPQVLQALADLDISYSPAPFPEGKGEKTPAQGAFTTQMGQKLSDTSSSPSVKDTGAVLRKSSLLESRGRGRMIRRDQLLQVGSILLALCLLVVLYAIMITFTCIDVPGATACTRILFIGNSYTTVNDLPGMFKELARSGGHKVDTGLIAEGGGTLSQQAISSQVRNQLKSGLWDFVVLQEQSQIPAVEPARQQGLYLAARILVAQIREAQALPIFFQTWAHRDGWPENGMPDYESMQSQINYGYQTIAQELNVAIAPAGSAWFAAWKQNPQWALWQEDGSHPTEQGTYLAACVFYAALFGQSPVGLSYMAHLPPETARSIQTIAANVVLQNPQQWNLR